MANVKWYAEEAALIIGTMAGAAAVGTVGTLVGLALVKYLQSAC